MCYIASMLIYPELYDNSCQLLKLHVFSWHPTVTLQGLYFSAHFGINLLPEPGVILDAESHLAMVMKDVAVISGPLFGGVMTSVQLVSLTAGGTGKKVCGLCACKNKFKCLK